MPPRRNTNSSPLGTGYPKRKSAGFILSSICDANNPEHCGTCLAGALYEITAMAAAVFENPGGAKSTAQQSLQDPKFWDGILAFLLLKRTDEQLDRLLTRLSECSCRMEDVAIAAYHRKGSSRAALSMARAHIDEGELGPVTSGRCSFIMDMFCVLCIVLKSSGVTSVAKGTSQSWPLHLTDLTPYGADSFVQSMLQWYRFVPETAIIHYTGLVLRICGTAVIPSLVKYRFSHAVIESCRQLVDLTLADLTQDLDERGRIRLAQRFRNRVLDYVGYFRAIENLITTKSDCFAELMRGCETKAMQFCSILLYLSSDPKMPSHDISDYMFGFAWYGQELFRFFHMHLYPRPDMPVHPMIEQIDSKIFPFPAALQEPAYLALGCILAFRVDRHCSAYKCPNTFQTVGKDFQRCSRCKVVSYCGRDCQANAWKDQSFPHKRTCSVMRNLINRGGGAELIFKKKGALFCATTHPTIFENWNKAGICEDDFSLLDNWYKAVYGKRGYPMPDGTEWTPGYDDYNDIIAKLTEKGRGPEGIYH
jgi:hypothetical protein